MAVAFGERRPSVLAPYVAVAVRAFRRYSTYRGAMLAGVVTNTVFGFIYASVFAAVHDRVGTVNGYDATATVTYVFASQALLAMTGAFGDREFPERVRTGDIAADLYRPVDFQAWWLAHDLGKAGFLAIFRGIPPFAIGVAVLDLPVPTDPVAWLAFGVTALLGVVVAFGVRFLVNLAGFWLVDVRGIISLVSLVQLFFAGHVVPLFFMPGWLEGLARVLPFAGITAVPVETLLGRHRGADLAVALGGQLAWIVVLLALGRLALAAARRKLELQGG